jgi:hypothetical protein
LLGIVLLELTMAVRQLGVRAAFEALATDSVAVSVAINARSTFAQLRAGLEASTAVRVAMLEVAIELQRALATVLRGVVGRRRHLSRVGHDRTGSGLAGSGLNVELSLLRSSALQLALRGRDGVRSARLVLVSESVQSEVVLLREILLLGFHSSNEVVCTLGCVISRGRSVLDRVFGLKRKTLFRGILAGKEVDFVSRCVFKVIASQRRHRGRYQGHKEAEEQKR